MEILPEYITAAEASVLLGISPREIYVLFNSGFLKGVEIPYFKFSPKIKNCIAVLYFLTICKDEEVFFFWVFH